MTAGVHQVITGAAPHDAITNHAIALRDHLRSRGLRSEVLADGRYIHPLVADRIVPHERWDAVAAPGDAAILHYSIDPTALEWVAARAARTALVYHNITPPELLWEHAPEIAVECLRGRRRLAGWADRVAVVAADSRFNAGELAGLGFPPAAVTGILRPELPLHVRHPADPESVELLFVGRGVPNKAQHDLISALAALRQAGVAARLRLVGSWASDAYRRFCLAHAGRLGVEDHLEVTGSVTDAELAEAYAGAAVFVCLSDHEGYCVPLIEAIRARTPVVAYAAGAVPETLGDAGLLIDDKRPSMVAEAVIEVLTNPRLAERARAGREAQLAALGPEATIAHHDALLERIVA